MKHVIVHMTVLCMFHAFMAVAQDEEDIIKRPAGVKGVGYSPYYKRAVDEGVARNEALLNAEKNALINYGGYIRLETVQHQDELTEGTGNEYRSNLQVSTRQIMRGMVKPLGSTHYRYEKEGSKKYIVAEGYFDVHPDGLEDLVSLYIHSTGKKINVELTDHASGYRIYPMLREYFNLKQNNFRFADRGHVFKSTDVFVINVFDDYIEFTMKQFKHNRYEEGPILKTYMFSTFHYSGCSDFIGRYVSSAPNEVFNDLMTEFYQVYFANNQDVF